MSRTPPFAKSRERLLKHDVSRKFFEAVLNLARQQRLLSNQHFTVDGTLLESWASLKSLKARGPNLGGQHKPKAGKRRPPARRQWQQSRGELPRREAKQRHLRLRHRSRGSAGQEGHRPRGQAQLRRAPAHGEPPRAGHGRPAHPATGTAERDAANTNGREAAQTAPDPTPDPGG